jgi:hypothetical protein
MGKLVARRISTVELKRSNAIQLVSSSFCLFLHSSFCRLQTLRRDPMSSHQSETRSRLDFAGKLQTLQRDRPLWNWPRKKYSLKLEINASLTRSPVQKQPDCSTAPLHGIGPGYKSTRSTRRWLIGPLASSGSVCDQYTPWSGWPRRTPWPRYRHHGRFDSCSPGCPTPRAKLDSGLR